MESKLASVLALAVSLVACEPSSTGTCGERDISAWVPLSGFPVTEIRCEGKLIGYEVDIAAKPLYQIWSLTNTESHPINGPLQIAADIDLAPDAVERVAKIARGSAVYDERRSGGVTVQAGATVVSGPMLREFQIKIPAGSAYKGQIRRVEW